MAQNSKLRLSPEVATAFASRTTDHRLTASGSRALLIGNSSMAMQRMLLIAPRICAAYDGAGPSATVGRHRLGPEHVQNSTPETWSHPNTMRASGARALGGMFCNARVTHTAKHAPRTHWSKKSNSVGTKKSCAGSAGTKKPQLDTQVTHWHTASRRCQPALLQTDRS